MMALQASCRYTVVVLHKAAEGTADPGKVVPHTVAVPHMETAQNMAGTVAVPHMAIEVHTVLDTSIGHRMAVHTMANFLEPMNRLDRKHPDLLAYLRRRLQTSVFL